MGAYNLIIFQNEEEFSKRRFQKVISIRCEKRNFSGSRIPTLHGCAHWPSMLRNKSIVHRSRQLFDTKAHRWPYRAVRLL